MRTIGQHEQEVVMVAHVKDIITRSHSALLEDIAGILALFIGLYAVLSF